MARRKMISRQLAKFEEPGQTWIGILAERGTQFIRNEDGSQHEIGRYVFTNEGGTYIVNGTNHIDEAMGSASIGDLIEIAFIGQQLTSNGFYVKQFEVYVHEPEASKDEEKQPAKAKSKGKENDSS